MFRNLSTLAGVALITLIATSPATAQLSAGMHRPVSAPDLTWSDVEVPGFAPGMKIAVVHGDPSVAEPYTLRLSFPAGYNFPPHWHPADESVTVLSGTFKLAVGEQRDDSRLRSYRAGDFVFVPARIPHFGGVDGPTVIQLHGTGPFTIEVVQAGQRR